MGGGNGTATVLRGLKQFPTVFEISAVVSMSDSGGSSGKLREEFKTLPAGDVLRAVLSLSIYDYKTVLKPLFYKKRFKDVGKLDGHNLGNLFLILAQNYNGSDFLSAVRALEQAVEAAGTVHPATLENSDLVAELEDGKIVKTEAKIDRPDWGWDNTIKKVWLEPDVQANPGALKALEEADYIILGPGSLYCSVIAATLAGGIKEAISRSKARLIHVVGNKYELDGERGPTSLCTSLWKLEEYLPRKIDMVIFNTMELSDRQRDHYEQKRWELLKYDPGHVKKSLVIGKPFERDSGGLSAIRLGQILKEHLSDGL